MTDATHDFGAADDGFHEIHLSGKQLVFLFIATTIVSVLIFLLGVMVGRGVPTERQALEHADPTPVASAATAPASTSASTPAPAEAAPPPVGDAPIPAAEQPSAPPATEDLSYKKRLESSASATESLKPRTTASSKPPPSAQNSAPAASQAVLGTPQPGVWIVQVHALRSRPVANGIVQRLVNKGYPAFLVEAGPPTGVFKVQVGRFKDRGDAERVVDRLKKEEQFKPWITR